MLFAVIGGVFLAACDDEEEPTGDVLGRETLPETPVGGAEADEVILIDGEPYQRVSIIPEHALTEGFDFERIGTADNPETGDAMTLYSLPGDELAIYTLEEAAQGDFWIRWLPAEESAPLEEE